MNPKMNQIFSYHLQFFAENKNGAEKTEDASSKKLHDARKEGQVAKSQELIMASSLMGLFLTLKYFLDYIGGRLLGSFENSFLFIETLHGEEFNRTIAMEVLTSIGKDIIIICIPVFITGVVIAFASNVFQMKWMVTSKPLHPKFEKINPLKGFSKIISKDKIVDLIKSILKIIIIGYLVYDTLKDQVYLLQVFYGIGNLEAAIQLVGTIVIDLGIKISLLFLVVGVADFFYQKFKFKKDMMMTKQEIKDEYKQTEGDPHIKAKIRQKMREVSQRRMMQQLPTADVVITNPTHFACALKYDKERAEAPILIAKGADYIAQKIKDAAKENQIPVVENKPLARMLYYNVDLEQEIPQELYQMVAEVLAYVYSLKQ